MTTPSLITEWAKACHADQLASYPPDNVSTQLIVILDQVLSSQISPKASASATANLIQSEHDITHGLSCLIGLFLFAAGQNTSLDSLELLVSYLVELAKQPDAINEGPNAKYMLYPYYATMIATSSGMLDSTDLDTAVLALTDRQPACT
jgi:hypothetical protein